MTGFKATFQSSTSPAPSLANRSLPPRVRTLLSGLLQLVTGQLQRRITSAFEDAEDLLSTMGGLDPAPGVDRIAATAQLQRAKTFVFPRFVVALEAALAVVRDPIRPSTSSQTGLPMSDWLTLVDHDTHAEESVITEVSSRANIRHSLALSLLGQRFGVVAARPPFEPDRLPFGPRQLCCLLSEAMNGLELPPAHRQTVLRQFDRTAVQHFGELVDAINAYLIREDVLPTLHFVPLRKRPQAQRGDERRARPEDFGRAQTAWPGEAPSEEAGADTEDPDLRGALQHLLAARAPERDEHFAPGTQVLTRDELDAILVKLQRRSAISPAVSVSNYSQIKAAIRAELPSFLTSAERVPLGEEDAELLELTCLLFEQIMVQVRPSSLSASLLGLIQVPLIRHILIDCDVLARRDHPARRMLNAIAESGAIWRAEQDTDPTLLARLHVIAERIAHEYDGNLDLFAQLNEEADDLIRTQIERAKLSERRHIDAARGREKLALARLKAIETLEASIAGRNIPNHVHTLLAQTWSDVLALTLLRHGAASSLFQRQTQIAHRLAAAASTESTEQEPFEGAEAVDLSEEIRQALNQVGYHDEEARMIATALTERRPELEADARQQIHDIQVRLSARARLGEQLHTTDGAQEAIEDDEVGAWRERLLDLPFGSWMEFGAKGPDAHPIRSRLAWFSAVTGVGLFVNTRGQRLGEHALSWLASEMAAGRLRVVEVGRDTLVDRAWDELVESLQRLVEEEPETFGAPA